MQEKEKWKQWFLCQKKKGQKRRKLFVSPPCVLCEPFPPPAELFLHQWRRRTLEKNPDEGGLSLLACFSSLGSVFSSKSPSSPSSCSSSDWSSSSKSSTSLSESSSSSSSRVESGGLDRAWSWLRLTELTAASILSWMAAVTAAVMTSLAIWWTSSKVLSAGWTLCVETEECFDLIGCCGWSGGKAKSRLRSSSSPLVDVPLSREGNSGRSPVNASSLSRSIKWSNF